MVNNIHLIKEHTLNETISIIKALLKGISLDKRQIQEIYVKAPQTPNTS